MLSLSLAQHAAALALALLDVVARGVRLRVLLRAPLRSLLIANTAGDTIAAITPARLGSEPVRFLFLRRAGLEPAPVLAGFATEYVIDGILLVACGGLLSVLFAAEGIHWLARIPEALSSPAAPWVAAVSLLVAAMSVAGLIRFRKQIPAPVVHSATEALAIVRHRPPRVTLAVAGLTLVSMAARTAILPVLAAGIPGVTARTLVLASYALVFGQTVMPTPAGAGGVELGFAAGFVNVLGGADVARLLFVWRVYSLVLGAVAGAFLLVGAGLTRRTVRSPH